MTFLASIFVNIDNKGVVKLNHLHQTGNRHPLVHSVYPHPSSIMSVVEAVVRFRW
jgi:hypothetical protein